MVFPDALSVELLYDFPVSPIHEIRSGAVCRDSQQILTLLANARDDITYPPVLDAIVFAVRPKQRDHYSAFPDIAFCLRKRPG